MGILRILFLDRSYLAQPQAINSNILSLMNSRYAIIVYLGLLLSIVSCSKETPDNAQDTELTGFIIGFDPCTINHSYPIGFVIVTNDQKDTLMVYNLSDQQFKLPANVLLQPDDTLFRIPAEYFEKYYETYLFPDTLRDKYALSFTYHLAKEQEKQYNLCTSDILGLNFPQAIIESAEISQ